MADLKGEQVQIVPVTWRDPRAVALRELMDAEMSALYGSSFSSSEPDEVFAARREALAIDPRDVLVTLLAIDNDGTPLAHAALRDLWGEWEVERLIVDQEARGLGIGRRIMAELETLARAGGARRMTSTLVASATKWPRGRRIDGMGPGSALISRRHRTSRVVSLVEVAPEVRKGRRSRTPSGYRWRWRLCPLSTCAAQ